jgi:hypothetical protein
MRRRWPDTPPPAREFAAAGPIRRRRADTPPPASGPTSDLSKFTPDGHPENPIVCLAGHPRRQALDFGLKPAIWYRSEAIPQIQLGGIASNWAESGSANLNRGDLAREVFPRVDLM